MGVVYVDQVGDLNQIDDYHYEINPAFVEFAQRLQAGDRLQLFGFEDRGMAKIFSKDIGDVLEQGHKSCFRVSPHPISGLFFPPCVSIVRM